MSPKSIRYTSKKRKKQRRPRRKTSNRNHTSYSVDESADVDKTMTILQLGSASMLRLDVKVNSTGIAAVIDTGAEVTIISDRVYETTY